MASKANRKPGLITFGWLLLGGAAAAVLGSKARRERMMNAVRGFADRFMPAGGASARS